MSKVIIDKKTEEYIYSYQEDDESCLLKFGLPTHLEQRRIYDELGLGTYERDEENKVDRLTLKQSDVVFLQDYLHEHDYAKIQNEYKQLAVNHKGLMVSGTNPKTIEHKKYSAFDEGKTEHELAVQLIKEGYHAISRSFKNSTDYDKAHQEFVEKNDYFFLKFIRLLISHMMKHRQTKEFTFEGEF